MTTDSQHIIIDFEPDGNGGIDLRVAAPAPNDESTFGRTMLSLDGALLDRVRSGEAARSEYDDVAQRVSDWLMGPDVQLVIGAALNRPENMRLLFRVRKPQLSQRLSDVPFELVRVAPHEPLLLNPKVSGFVHVLPKLGGAPVPANREWPLKVLVIRANPKDLGDRVPEVKPLVTWLEAIAAQHYGKGAVLVDVLSREAPYGAAATWQAVTEKLKASYEPQLNRSYDILVFVGHGNVIQESSSVGVLQLEGDRDNDVAVSVFPAQLTQALGTYPVPVVLLAGCLTAAQIQDTDRAEINRTVSQWMQGARGVAQALINSSSGVQLAVGLRYKLETDSATKLLQAFFESLLLGPHRGDVEHAVRAGRAKLFAAQPTPPMWSAPVIFRANGGDPATSEPLFPFLAKQPTLAVDDNFAQEKRALAWTFLATQRLSTRAPGSTDVFVATLRDAERALLDLYRGKNIAVIMAERPDEAAPGAVVRVPIRLHGSLVADEVEGRLSFESPAMRVVDWSISDDATNAGFELLSNKASARFLLRRVGGAAPLPEAILLEASVSTGQAPPGVCRVTIEDLRARPHQPLHPERNAILTCLP